VQQAGQAQVHEDDGGAVSVEVLLDQHA